MNWAVNYVCVLRTCKRSFAFSDCDHFVFLLRYFFFRTAIKQTEKWEREGLRERERESDMQSPFITFQNGIT